MFFGPLLQNPPSFPAQALLFFIDNAVNEALRALNTANLRRYTDLRCPKARRWRLKAVQRLVGVLLGDRNVVCGTNTKGEVCLSGGACTALSGPLGGHLSFTPQEHEALSMLRMACSMHLSQRALLRMPRRCTQRDLRTVRQRIMPYFPQTTIVKSTKSAIGQLPMCLCNQLCKMQYLWPELLGNPSLVVLPLLLYIIVIYFS